MSSHRLFKAILLVAGTAIGGGMLALPVLTGLCGFVPAVVLFILCWICMTSTGLYALEVYLWTEGDTNLISMAELTLGRFGKVATWALYIFFFYCLSVAYTIGCGKSLIAIFGETLTPTISTVLVTVLFSPLIYAGAWLVGRVNIPLMIGLIVCYFLFVITGAPYVNFDYILYQDWLQTLDALPVAFAAFGFHGIIPTLGRYLDRDRRATTIAIIVGSAIPLVTYIIWEGLILGIVPATGPNSLQEAIHMDATAVQPLKAHIGEGMIYYISQGFAFFALVTSFLGVTLGLRDFLADGLGIEKTPKGRLFLCTIIFIPVLLIAISYPTIFLVALRVAGGIGASLLLALIPILMVWAGRYHHRFSGARLVSGGRPFMVALIFFIMLELGVELLHIFG